MSGPLYRHIGSCIDDSPSAEMALAHARPLWSPGQSRLSLVHVATAVLGSVTRPPHPLLFESIDGSTVPSPVDINSVERAWLDARARETPGAVPVFLEGSPGPEICRWATASEADLLVAATRGGGWARARAAGGGGRTRPA